MSSEDEELQPQPGQTITVSSSGPKDLQQEVQEEAFFHGYDLPPGLWFATRNGDLQRMHDSLWHRRDFVHDMLQQPFFREEVDFDASTWASQ